MVMAKAEVTEIEFSKSDTLLTRTRTAPVRVNVYLAPFAVLKDVRGQVYTAPCEVGKETAAKNLLRRAAKDCEVGVRILSYVTGSGKVEFAPIDKTARGGKKVTAA
jgi:hypothetical protein